MFSRVITPQSSPSWTKEMIFLKKRCCLGVIWGDIALKRDVVKKYPLAIDRCILFIMCMYIRRINKKPCWKNRTIKKMTWLKSHVLVCFLAFVLWKTFGLMCKNAGLGDEMRRVVNEIKKVSMVDVVLTINGWHRTQN